MLTCYKYAIDNWIVPDIVLSFVKHHLHGGPLDSIDAEALKKENEELQQRNRELEEQVAQLQTAVSIHYAIHIISLCFVFCSYPSTNQSQLKLWPAEHY